MRFTISSILLVASLFAVDTDAKACGVKVIAVRRGPKYTELHQTRVPKEASEPRQILAAPAPVEPVSAGPKPKPEERKLTAQKPPEEAPAEAAPAPEPSPAPVAAAPQEKEEAPAAAPAKPPKNFAAELTFRPNSAELTAGAKAKLKADAAWLKSHPGTQVVVEGHADPAGPSDYNMELSERRAASVRDALVEAGVDVSNIEVQAFGEDKPAYKSPAKNRRAVLVVKENAVVNKDEQSR